MSWKPHFRRFLEADPARLHFAAHSHHYWPDVAFEAQQACWNDAARLADGKWDKIFGEVIPETQRRVARILKLPDPTTLAFGPNTHSFLLRLLSCLPQERPIAVLASDGEFHSLTRQMKRLEEAGRARVSWIPTEPFATFEARFKEAAVQGRHDLVYVSQVFFNSGFALADLPGLVATVPHRETLIAVDGYHAFMARPLDIAAVADRAFYLAGGYKYAMAGEGCCFIHCPPGYGARPLDSGWFAGFGALAAPPGDGLGYADDGSRFLGATFDPVGLYRLNAVLSWQEEHCPIDEIADHAVMLQELFLERLADLGRPRLTLDHLLSPRDPARRGNFLAFRTPEAGPIHKTLLSENIVTDHRGDVLRFGFGVYQDEEDVRRLVAALGCVLA
ncbi:MAG: aminotransferase class V-fold PLP-dependent enzyme [Kiloniellales bacterium]